MKKRFIAGLVTLVTVLSLFLPVALAAKLSYGSEGAQVVQAQKRLKELGYYSGTVDGKYGYKTVVAVRVFQSKNSLKVDGVIGTKTNLYLYADSAIKKSGGTAGVAKTLRIAYGAEGPAVTTIQTKLAALKYYKGKVDGKFGGSTAKAVRSFQAAKGLKVDSVVGPLTWAALVGKVNVPKPPTPKNPYTPVPIPKNPRVQYGYEGYLVKLAQQRLADLGYKVGKVDGKFGFTTYQAARAFQAKNNLKVDGIIGPTTWKKLFAATAVPAVSPPKPAVPGKTVFRIRYGASGAKVTQLQVRLIELGYLGIHQDDGKFGYRTYLAVRSFQHVNKLKVDGVVGQKTWDAVMSLKAIYKPKK